MKKLLFILANCLFISIGIYAQDIHYSQFYADPIRLNPAMTGNFNGDYRWGANARSQWNSVTVPYQTLSAFADLSLFKNKSPKRFRSRKGQVPGGTWMGSGLRVLYDRAGDGVLNTTEIQGTGAIHHSFNNQFYVSLGAGAMYSRTNIDYTKLYFGTQWSENDFNVSLSNQDIFNNEQFSHWDIQVGTNMSIPLGEIGQINGGFSLLHLNQAKDTFIEADNQLGIRSIANVGGSFKMGEKLILEPAAYFTSQKKASEVMLGANIVYNLGETYNKGTNKFYFGTWYRSSDAIALLIGLEFINYRVLASYDLNISSLSTASSRRGGIELSLVHVGLFKSTKQAGYVGCPRF